jgi:hypothetical protein
MPRQCRVNARQPCQNILTPGSMFASLMVVVDYILVEFRPLGERRRALAALALALEACSTFIYLTSDVFYTAYSTISPPHFTVGWPMETRACLTSD